MRLFREKNPFASDTDAEHAGRFGLNLFLVSLAMLFAATVVGFAVIRFELRAVWPDELPPLPRLLWASTALLVTSSGTIQLAVAAARRGRGRALAAGMLTTTLLGFAFLGLQTVCWIDWLAEARRFWQESDGYRFALTGFYVMTGLHALHVVGGLIPMVVVTRRALGGRYSEGRHRGVVFCAVYWHFLDGVWLVLFGALLLGV